MCYHGNVVHEIHTRFVCSDVLKFQKRAEFKSGRFTAVTALYTTDNTLASLHKVIWKEGRVAALSHMYAVKSPLVYNGAPQIRPQKYPFLRTYPQTPLPASSLDPSDLWCQAASGSDPSFFHNALDRQTDRQTERPTDRSGESLTTRPIGRCATRATRPNNNNNNLI